jgi:hypothetical protein
MASHTIKVFKVDFPDGTRKLQYIHHQSAHPTEDEPGTPVQIKHGSKIHWVSMSGGNITVDFTGKSATSPFVSGAMTLPTGAAAEDSGWQTLAKPAAVGGGSLVDFQYTVTVVGAAPDDPDLIIDVSGGSGGGRPKHKRPRPNKKVAKKPPKRK